MRSTESTQPTATEDVPLVPPRDCPPWKTCLLRWISAKTPLREVYRRVGWYPGIRATRMRFPDLRMSEAVKLADAIGAPRGPFLATLAFHLSGTAKPMRPRLALTKPKPEAVQRVNRGRWPGAKNLSPPKPRT